MSYENSNLREEVETQEKGAETKPQSEGDVSEDKAAEEEELDSLFSDVENSETTSDLEELKREVANLKKGVAKFFSEKGREQKKEMQEKTSATPVFTNPVLKNLYFKANPEAELVWEEVEKEAQNLGRDPFELYENSKYFKGEAKARLAAKKEEEENKFKIDKPSSGFSSGKIPFERIDLKNKDHVAYINSNPEIRERYMKWFAANVGKK